MARMNPSMAALHTPAAVGVRPASPQGPWWGHVPPYEGPCLCLRGWAAASPRDTVKAGAVFLAAQWHHAGMSGGISITVMAIRYQHGEH